MQNIHAKSHELALKADRKILTMSEESYIRLDLNAHEKAVADILEFKKSFLSFLPFSSIKNFAITALLIYGVLFVITNAHAYSKIALSSILNVFEDNKSTTLPQISDDPWDEKILATNASDYESDQNTILNLALIPTPYDNRVKIPALKIDAPIVEPELGLSAIESNDWESLEEQIKDSLLKGIVHYPGTAYPGQKGNVFLTGHSSNVFWEISDFNTVFALLPKIKIGDDIYIAYNQISYHYRVIDKKEVYPNDVSSLVQGDDYKLTLVTCTPVGTDFRRLIVTAELIKD